MSFPTFHSTNTLDHEGSAGVERWRMVRRLSCVSCWGSGRSWAPPMCSSQVLHIHEANCTRLTNLYSINHPIIKNFLSMSRCLSTAVLPSVIRRFNRSAPRHESQQPRYAPHPRCLIEIDIISNLATRRATDPTATAACLSTSSTMIRFSTYFASIDRRF